MAKQIVYAAEARDKLVAGINKTANAVKVTLGPKGKIVALGKRYGAPRMTKDGVSVAKEIELEDPLENMGAQMVREAASKANDHAGDGTTTATVLAQALVNEGHKLVAAGMNPMDLKRGIDKAVAAVTDDLKARARIISDNKEIHRVAFISANGDSQIAEYMATAMEKLGKEGVVTVEEGKSHETELDIVEGMQIDRGVISPHFFTHPEKLLCELEKPYVLLHDQKISALQPLMPLLEGVAQEGRPLLIVAEDVDGEALATLVLNKLRGALRVCAIRSTGFGDQRKAILQDLAVLTGGQVLSEDTGIKLNKATLDMLGTCRTVRITRDTTTFVEGAGDKDVIAERCKQLSKLLEETDTTYEKGKIEERLAKLSGGIAVIRVGGSTDLEMRERKDRVDDAVHATRAAIQEGVVVGGGCALLYASKILKDIPTENEDERAGVDVVRRALQAPIRQIITNAGEDASLIVGKLLEQDSQSRGYNAQRGEFVDMFEAGIIDPAKVVRIALQDAASVAGQVVTTEALINDIPEKEKPKQPQQMGDW